MKFPSAFHCAVGAAILAWAAHAAPTHASSTMFVEGDKTSTWEGRLKLVSNLKQDGGVSLEVINAFVRERLSRRAVSSPLAAFTPICLMNVARPQDIVSSDRATQAAIKADLQEYPRTFAETYEAGTEKFLLRVGIFEDCKAPDQKNATPTTFMALIITDSEAASASSMLWTGPLSGYLSVTTVR